MRAFWSMFFMLTLTTSAWRNSDGTVGKCAC